MINECDIDMLKSYGALLRKSDVTKIVSHMSKDEIIAMLKMYFNITE